MKKKLLKMQELSEATGVSGGTIRFYVQKGILPKPLKTHRNMAYYDESYIERIRLIKELQTKRYLPLNIIKMMLESRDFSMDTDQRRILQEMEKPLFEENGEADPPPIPLTREALAEHAGLPLSDVESLEAMGMIEPDEQGNFGPECARLAELVAEIRRVGLTEDLDFRVEDLRIHLDLIEFLSRKEIELFARRMVHKGMSPQQISAMAQNAVRTVDKILPILHRRMIRKLTEEMG